MESFWNSTSLLYRISQHLEISAWLGDSRNWNPIWSPGLPTCQDILNSFQTGHLYACRIEKWQFINPMISNRYWKLTFSSFFFCWPVTSNTIIWREDSISGTINLASQFFFCCPWMLLLNTPTYAEFSTKWYNLSKDHSKYDQDFKRLYYLEMYELADTKIFNVISPRGELPSIVEQA